MTIWDCPACCGDDDTCPCQGERAPGLLDLFGGAGGVGVGYHRAGFDVTALDIEPHPDNPFELIVADALEFMTRPSWHEPYDVIHASPPCQAKTTMSNRYRGKGGVTDAHVNLIAPVREALLATGKPYVIENVCGARPDLRAPIMLTGGMFGLRVERPRLFESNVPLTPAPARKAVDPLGIYGKRQGPDGRRLWTRKDGSILRAPRTLQEAQEAMDVGWMTVWEDITECVPPAYTEYIGKQLLAVIAEGAAA